MWFNLLQFFSLFARKPNGERSNLPATREEATIARDKVHQLLLEHSVEAGVGIRPPSYFLEGYTVVVHLTTDIPSEIKESIRDQVDITVYFDVVGKVIPF